MEALLNFNHLCCTKADCCSKSVQMHHKCEHCGKDCETCDNFPYIQKNNGAPKTKYTFCRKCGKELNFANDTSLCEKCWTQPHKEKKTRKERKEQEIKDNKKLDQTIELAEKLPPKPQKEPKITKIPNEKLKLKTIMDLKQINFDHTNPKNKHKMTKMIQSFWGLWKKDKEGCRLRGIYPYRSPDGKWYLCDAGHPLKDKKKKKTTKKVNPKNTLGAFIR